ncbi:MAG: nucleotide pyrophosphohydrolase [Pseudomonadota bacterium]
MSDSLKNQNALQSIAKIREFCEARDWDQFHSPKELAIGLVTEASELLEIFRFQSEAQISELLEDADSRESIADELADVYFFLLRFADRNGFDLESALARKMAKNNEKYPVEKSRGRNQKYTEYCD